MNNRLKSWTRGSIVCLLACAAVILVPAALSACPTCKDQLASDANSSGIVSGYFWSILLMLSMPIVILSSLGAYVFYQLSKADSQLPPLPMRKAAAAPSPANDREAVGV